MYAGDKVPIHQAGVLFELRKQTKMLDGSNEGNRTLLVRSLVQHFVVPTSPLLETSKRL